MTQNMETDPFNVSMRKFLKQVGVTSQQAIEKAVADAGLKGQGRLTVRAVITAERAGLHHVVEGDIDLG
ncbi:MAG: hypothetical protein E5Y63_17745 [Mesorhizobium sp.]|jgi:hypothetical protein|uniref:Uncharacterized protein n=1 Tax=Mesorhizobium ventifaucium TaxID=666020 RepID=A0ABM9DVI3_9HYPH|nr:MULTISPECIES: DUF6494 family protein [Mesorhizobium]RWC01448.1 MAG: hypothetical protein EOQ56_13160 [Mesorhizobium sp.]RWI23984.1 MAG: hypothetical protein EOQ92_15065 [Mesorhizobium sp.]RWK51493.1 MAG: hypothetical protein EOR47_07265 [Mesorhizobium sp.]RWK56253.1 MAG: hypothetical protein EOR48_08140 [Mesorhizobium sp.]RWK84326.1 MAG: hypothetical protein EOR45_31050 [Mesorhizobium sp.]